MMCLCNQPAVQRTVSKAGPNQGKQFFSCQTGTCGFFHWEGQPMPASLHNRAFLQQRHGPSSGNNNNNSSSSSAAPAGKASIVAKISLLSCEIDERPPKVWLSLFFPYCERLTALLKTLPVYFEQSRKIWRFELRAYEEVVAAIASLNLDSFRLDELPRFLLTGLKNYLQRLSALPESERDVENLRITESLRETLLPFQLEGVRFVVSRGGKAFIGDEMGCGKTVQAIAILQHYRAHWPALLLLPPNLVTQWHKELLHFSSDLLSDADICVVRKASDPTHGRIVIVPYSIIDRLVSENKLVPESFGLVIADESHSLKSVDAKRTVSVLPFLKQAKIAICLSGTPAVNRPVELFSQLHGLLPFVFTHYDHFIHRYCDAKPNKFNANAVDAKGSSNEAELKMLLESLVMIRRLKADVINTLPIKQRDVRYVDADSALVSELHRIQKRQAVLDAAMKDVTKDNEERVRLKQQSQQLLLLYYQVTGMSKIKAIQEELFQRINAARLHRALRESSEENERETEKEKLESAVQTTESVPSSDSTTTNTVHLMELETDIVMENHEKDTENGSNKKKVPEQEKEKASKEKKATEKQKERQREKEQDREKKREKDAEKGPYSSPQPAPAPTPSPAVNALSQMDFLSDEAWALAALARSALRSSETAKPEEVEKKESEVEAKTEKMDVQEAEEKQPTAVAAIKEKEEDELVDSDDDEKSPSQSRKRLRKKSSKPLAKIKTEKTEKPKKKTLKKNKKDLFVEDDEDDEDEDHEEEEEEEEDLEGEDEVCYVPREKKSVIEVDLTDDLDDEPFTSSKRLKQQSLQCFNSFSSASAPATTRSKKKTIKTEREKEEDLEEEELIYEEEEKENEATDKATMVSGGGLGEKILVFAHHHKVLDAIEDVLRQSRVGFIRVDGTTTKARKDKLIHNFQTSPDVDVALLSITACGTGLNLTTANVAIFAELYWSPGVVLQAEDRIHRIGQKSKEVKLIYLLARNTADDVVWDQIQKKYNVLGATIGNAQGSNNFANANIVSSVSSAKPRVKESTQRTLDDFSSAQYNEPPLTTSAINAYSHTGTHAASSQPTRLVQAQLNFQAVSAPAPAQASTSSALPCEDFVYSLPTQGSAISEKPVAESNYELYAQSLSEKSAPTLVNTSHSIPTTTIQSSLPSHSVSKAPVSVSVRGNFHSSSSSTPFSFSATVNDSSAASFSISGDCSITHCSVSSSVSASFPPSAFSRSAPSTVAVAPPPVSAPQKQPLSSSYNNYMNSSGLNNNNINSSMNNYGNGNNINSSKARQETVPPAQTHSLSHQSGSNVPAPSYSSITNPHYTAKPPPPQSFSFKPAPPSGGSSSVPVPLPTTHPSPAPPSYAHPSVHQPVLVSVSVPVSAPRGVPSVGTHAVNKPAPPPALSAPVPPYPQHTPQYAQRPPQPQYPPQPSQPQLNAPQNPHALHTPQAQYPQHYSRTPQVPQPHPLQTTQAPKLAPPHPQYPPYPQHPPAQQAPQPQQTVRPPMPTPVSAPVPSTSTPRAVPPVLSTPRPPAAPAPVAAVRSSAPPPPPTMHVPQGIPPQGSQSFVARPPLPAGQPPAPLPSGPAPELTPQMLAKIEKNRQEALRKRALAHQQATERPPQPATCPPAPPLPSGSAPPHPAMRTAGGSTVHIDPRALQNANKMFST